MQQTAPTDPQVVRSEMRKFALSMTVGFGVLGGIFFLLGARRGPTVLWIIAGVFLVAGFTMPAMLKPIHRVWMQISLALGWFNTRLLLTVMFYLVFFPVALLMKLFGRDSLSRKMEPETKSFWQRPETEPFDRRRLERQF